jgi:methylthioribose-1-phosphate isomerase
MAVRGAPAIGLTAAYALVLAAQEAAKSGARGDARLAIIVRARDVLAQTRPTAVNLAWALDEVLRVAREDPSPGALLQKAEALHAEDVAGNERIGRQLLARLRPGMNVLTHCNAGALATGGLGTALSGLFLARELGLPLHVWVSETRPRLQGARLTAWELTQAGIDCTLITDNMAASLMAKGRVDLVVTGADRIAANGDTANKVGTSMHAVCAAHFGVPFHVAAPRSTFDLTLSAGDQIPIEERSWSEVTTVGSERLCPEGMKVYNPGFDVTPAALIRSCFTDRGEIEPVSREAIARVMRGP